MVAKLKFTEPTAESTLLKLDLGCGRGANTPDGFEKIDLHKSPGVRQVDLRGKWPWKSNTVDEAQANYLLHCLTMPERVHFANELYRVLKPGAKCMVIAPHWCAARAYSDPTAQWPPIAEGWFPWLNRAWRDAQGVADGSDLVCDFDIGLGYSDLHPALQSRNQEYVQHAFTFWKEAAQSLVATLTKLEPSNK